MSDRKKPDTSRSRARSAFYGGALGTVLVLVPSILWASGFSLPHNFAPNSPAKSSDMNDNFGAIATTLNKTTAFVHVTTTANTLTNPVTNYSCIDNPATNGDPTATLFVTRVLGIGFADDLIPSGLNVFYYTTGNQWCIQRQDTQQMPLNAGFNVLVVKP